MSLPNLKQISNILLEEKQCINFLISNNIIQKPQCQYCNSELNQIKKLFRCKNPSCRKAVSIYKDLFFAKHHIISFDILLLAYL